jgi:hypothetical protein
MLNEATCGRDQNGSDAQETITWLHKLPHVFGPKGSVIDIGDDKLMLLEECKLQPNGMMSSQGGGGRE